MQAEAVTRTAYDHGEGVRWDAARRELLWVDISAGRLMRGRLDALDAPEVAEIGTALGAVTTMTDGSWLLAAGPGLAHLSPGGKVRDLVTLEPADVRMNDAACDPVGRFWAGSMAYDERPGAGSLHLVDLDGRVTTVLRDLTISNGVGWSPDGTVMYLNDSGPSVTWAFDYDVDTGALARQRVLAEHRHGVCDGLTVDAEGCLWVALWGGAAIDRIDPGGRRLQRVEVPVEQPSDCCLVEGRLLITTARHKLAAPGPDDGRLYAADVGVDGPPVQPFLGVLPG